MNELVTLFIEEVTALSPGLRAAYQETKDYWAPDDAPVTTALSELGHRLVDDFDTVDTAVNEAVFDAIERALVQDEHELTIAVATGMIEGIVGRAVRAGTWDEVRPMLRKQSAAHAAAWTSLESLTG